MIAGAILVNDFNKQIVGDESFEGILDVERDIKSTLFSFYPDLDGNCLYFSLSTVSYSTLESGNGRVVFIEVYVLDGKEDVVGSKLLKAEKHI